MEDLQPLINQKIRMCTQLYGSRSFVSVLEYLLSIGNYLNENAGKGKAKGFRLSSLTKLSQLHGTDRKFTLLHALVEQIMLHEAGLATFPQELAEFETVPGASIKGLTAEVDVLKNELQKVIQYRKTYKRRNQGEQYPKFSKDLKMTIEKYNTDLSLLTKRCEEMKKLYTDILEIMHRTSSMAGRIVMLEGHVRMSLQEGYHMREEDVFPVTHSVEIACNDNKLSPMMLCHTAPDHDGLSTSKSIPLQSTGLGVTLIPLTINANPTITPGEKKTRLVSKEHFLPVLSGPATVGL
ncbi:formin-A-like isoform 1-T1 [Salvelinus alpinus]